MNLQDLEPPQEALEKLALESALHHWETLLSLTPHMRLAMKRAYASFIRMMILKRRIITFANNSTSLVTLNRFKLSTPAPRVAKTWLIVHMGPSGWFHWLLGPSQRRTQQLKSCGSVRILLKYATGLLCVITDNAF
jgi:hypothetical protein